MSYVPFALPTLILPSHRSLNSRAAAPDEVSTKLPSPVVKGHIISEIRCSESVICVRWEKTIDVYRLESLRGHVSKESVARVSGTGRARIRNGTRCRNDLEDRAVARVAFLCPTGRRARRSGLS